MESATAVEGVSNPAGNAIAPPTSADGSVMTSQADFIQDLNSALQSQFNGSQRLGEQVSFTLQGAEASFDVRDVSRSAIFSRRGSNNEGN